MAFLIIPVSDCLQKEPESMWLRLRQGGQWSPGVVGTCGSLQSPSISAQCPPRIAGWTRWEAVCQLFLLLG